MQQPGTSTVQPRGNGNRSAGGETAFSVTGNIPCCMRGTVGNNKATCVASMAALGATCAALGNGARGDALACDRCSSNGGDVAISGWGGQRQQRRLQHNAEARKALLGHAPTRALQRVTACTPRCVVTMGCMQCQGRSTTPSLLAVVQHARAWELYLYVLPGCSTRHWRPCVQRQQTEEPHVHDPACDAAYKGITPACKREGADHSCARPCVQ